MKKQNSKIKNSDQPEIVTGEDPGFYSGISESDGSSCRNCVDYCV